jgi:hypothetical protein
VGVTVFTLNTGVVNEVNAGAVGAMTKGISVDMTELSNGL